MLKRRPPGTGRAFYLDDRTCWCALLYLPPSLDDKAHSWTRTFKLKLEAAKPLADALQECEFSERLEGWRGRATAAS